MIQESKKVLMINRFGRIVGGIERYMLEMSRVLREENWIVYGCFFEGKEVSAEFADAFDRVENFSASGFTDQLLKIKSEGVYRVVIHKLMDPVLLEKVIGTFPNSVVIIHDHDYYCMRRHKYFPFNRINCQYPFNILRCSICSGMMTKVSGCALPVKFYSPAFFARALNVLKRASTFVVLSDFMKRNLLDNGFPEEKIRKVYPLVNIPAIMPAGKEERTESPFKLLFAGQIIRGKGLDLL